MKVGILTYHKAINYGAVLQAFALQSYLKELGHDVEILNYYNKQKKKTNYSKFQSIRTFFWKPLGRILGKSKKIKRFAGFREKFLNISKENICNVDELAKYVKTYNFEALIVGSDQVWNPNINGHDKAFYFGFKTSARKISYAASFGTSILNKEDSLEIAKHLKDFYFISLREKTGLNLIDNMKLDKDATTVVDPVFLNGALFWKNLVGDRIIKKRYVFCYVMPGDKNVEKKITSLANEYHKKTGARVVYVGRKEYKRFVPDGKDYIATSPIDFVNLIYYADMIITSSFHGTALSVLLNKPFYSINNTSKNHQKQYGSRIIDLLDILKLSDRIIYCSSKPDLYSKIEYNLVNEKLEKLISESKTALKNALN